MFAAPSTGSVTSNLKLLTLVAARRATLPSPSPPEGERAGVRGTTPSRRRWRRPLQARLPRRSRLIEAAHRCRHRRLVDQMRIFLRLARDLDHRVAELVERLLRLR